MQYEGRSEMVWTWTAVSANNKLWDLANYRLIMKL